MSLIAAKTSLFSQAEMTRESMPRKEIIALDLGARLLRECLDSTTLPIERFEVWTDSQTVVKWCTNKDLELRVFERNRVDLILRNTKRKPPRYIPTNLNPADVGTRPCRVSQKERWNMWTGGPQFLSGPVEDWDTLFSHDSETVNVDVKLNAGSNVANTGTIVQLLVQSKTLALCNTLWKEPIHCRELSKLCARLLNAQKFG